MNHRHILEGYLIGEYETFQLDFEVFVGEIFDNAATKYLMRHPRLRVIRKLLSSRLGRL